MSWERTKRTVKYQTSHMSVYEDVVVLPNGHVIDGFSVVSVRNGVVVVAKDQSGDLIVVKEYKYAIDKDILVLPAGGIEDGDSPIQAAKKELLEETGYSGGEIELITAYNDYPSKMTHTTYVVRMTNVQKISDAEHEDTEEITDINALPVSEITPQTFVTSVNVAALKACGIL